MYVYAYIHTHLYACMIPYTHSHVDQVSFTMKFCKPLFQYIELLIAPEEEEKKKKW